MEMAFVLPVLPGKRDALLALTDALREQRRAEFDWAQVTVTRETWYLQATPLGDVLAVSFEAPDPAAVFRALAGSDEPFDVWLKQQLLEITGCDLNQPPDTLPVRAFHWSRS